MDNETLKHFLFECKELEHVRKPVLKDFLQVCNSLVRGCPLEADLSQTKLIVDTSVILQDITNPDKDTKDVVELIHFHSRRLVYSKNRYNSGIVLRKVGIPTLSANSGIVPDNSKIAHVIYIVLLSDMICVQSTNRVGHTKGSANRE